MPTASETADPNAARPHGKSPLALFALVFALSIPFWLLGRSAERQLRPGLPLAALGAVPALAASILVYGEEKAAGLIDLLKRSFDYQRITARVWYVPVVLLMPGVTVLAY